MNRLIRSRAVKLLLLAGTLLLAGAALVDALAQRWRVTDPEAALRLYPSDPVAITISADRRAAGQELGTADAAPLAAGARAALRGAPLGAAALRQLATAAALSGDEARADTLLHLAHRVSRRELGTLIWLVQASLDKDDLPALLRYSDQALTVDTAAAEMLFPALAVGMADPQAQRILAAYLRQDRPWMPALLRYALDDTQRGEAGVVAIIAAAGGLPRTAAYADIDGRLFRLLARHGGYDLARSYLARLGNAGSPLGSDPVISSRTTAAQLGPFGWAFYDTAEYGARPTDGGRIAVRMAPDRRARLAQRILLLPAGSYVVAIADARGAGSALDIWWEVSCLSGEGRWIIWQQDAMKPSRPSPLTVPEGCEAQQLDLVANTDRGVGDTVAELAPPVLRRVDQQTGGPSMQ